MEHLFNLTVKEPKQQFCLLPFESEDYITQNLLNQTESYGTLLAK